MARDQDSLTPDADLEIQEAITQYNDLGEEDLARGALNHRHVPPFPLLPTGIYARSGGHGTLPGFERYSNPVITTALGSNLLPVYDHRLGSTPMRTTGAGAPYGADSGVGWSIIARNNSPTEAAELGIGINYAAGSDFAEGEMSIEFSGTVEATRGDDGSGEAYPGSDGYLLGVAVKLGTDWYVIPHSIGMWPSQMHLDSMQIRCEITAAICTALSDSVTTLSSVAMVVACVAPPSPLPDPYNFQLASCGLGCWSISLDPFVSDS